MAEIIHKKGDQYRVWSTMSDVYTTEPMSRADMREHLYRPPPETIDERLDRVDRTGTSEHGTRLSLSAWAIERCSECGSFHHRFGSSGGLRMCCDEPEDAVCHGPPCVPKEA